MLRGYQQLHFFGLLIGFCVCVFLELFILFTYIYQIVVKDSPLIMPKNGMNKTMWNITWDQNLNYTIHYRNLQHSNMNKK